MPSYYFKILDRIDRKGEKYNNDFLLRWQGPWQRSDFAHRYPDNATEDTKAVKDLDCDVTIFLVYNNFTKKEVSDGHKNSGFAYGEACDAKYGEGYAVVVDQGMISKLFKSTPETDLLGSQ